MHRRTWQREETEVARLFGAEQRRAVTEDRYGHGLDDVDVPCFSVEVKLQKSLGFQALLDAVVQAEGAATREGSGKVPLAVARRPGDAKSDRLVVVRLSTFLEHFVDFQEADESPSSFATDSGLYEW
jgi:hypothetical protein